MTYDVFVSYSTKDKGIADSIVAALEQNSIRCWYAPRDIKPGSDWGDEIAQAINRCTIFLLIFSGNSNHSQRVLDELNLAITKEVTILPFRVEKLEPSGAMQLHLSARHWLDAYDPSWEHHITQLIDNISANIGTPGKRAETTFSQRIEKGAKRKTNPIGKTMVAFTAGVILILAVWFAWPRVFKTNNLKAKDTLLCQLTNSDNVEDNDIDELIWKGIQQVVLDAGVQTEYIEFQDTSDVQDRLDELVNNNCDLIISGSTYESTVETLKYAELHPEIKFAMPDSDNGGLGNVRGNVFSEEEIGFLAGYLAAGMTETGKVGTYVGFLIPVTEQYLNGYSYGIQYYNHVHGESIQLIGWDEETLKGLTVDNWSDSEVGYFYGKQLLDQGVDIIFPIAGTVPVGTLEIMEERGTGLLIGADLNWPEKYPEYSEQILASVTKTFSPFISDCVNDLAFGNFSGGENFLSDLGNGGIELVYSSTWADKVPDQINSELNAWIPLIVSGEIKIKSY